MLLPRSILAKRLATNTRKRLVVFLLLYSTAVESVQKNEDVIGKSSSFLIISSSFIARTAAVNSNLGIDTDLMEANLDLPAMKDKEMLPASSANLK